MSSVRLPVVQAQHCRGCPVVVRRRVSPDDERAKFVAAEGLWCAARVPVLLNHPNRTLDNPASCSQVSNVGARASLCLKSSTMSYMYAKIEVRRHYQTATGYRERRSVVRYTLVGDVWGQIVVVTSGGNYAALPYCKAFGNYVVLAVTFRPVNDVAFLYGNGAPSFPVHVDFYLYCFTFRKFLLFRVIGFPIVSTLISSRPRI